MASLKLGDIEYIRYKGYTEASTNFSDILVGGDKVYCVNRNLNNVYVYSKNKDGTLKSYLYFKDWYTQDTLISEICASNSSIPYSYTLYVDGGKDYLVGWGTNSRIIVWEIDQNGNISSSRRTIHSGQERAITSYSRAGWDGDNYVWFYDRGTNRVFKWDITVKGVAKYVVTTNGNYSMTSSYTGAGLIVDDNYIYWGSGANQASPTVGAFSLADGTGQGSLGYLDFRSLDNPVWNSTSLPSNTTSQYTPLHPDICYLISVSMNGVYYVQIETNYGIYGFDDNLAITKDFETGKEYYATDEVDLEWTALKIITGLMVPLKAEVTATTNGNSGETYGDGKLYRAIIKRDEIEAETITVDWSEYHD